MEQPNQIELKPATLQRVIALELQMQTIQQQRKAILDTVLEEHEASGEWTIGDGKLVRVEKPHDAA